MSMNRIDRSPNSPARDKRNARKLKNPANLGATTAGYGTVLQAAPVVNLTDSSTGTSGGDTVGAVTDIASAANAIATLTAKLNALLTAERNAGQIAP